MRHPNRLFLTLLLIGVICFGVGGYLIFTNTGLNFDEKLGIILLCIGASIVSVTAGMLIERN